ncbi:hypothetical protein ACFSRY_15090 [Pontibacter locisalis]|uniref:EF-hand domain-containing protein n=1 Tax=Pontibacter locisalis TaxID=1719035 RepID=A0ABW5INK2_9BACT
MNKNYIHLLLLLALCLVSCDDDEVNPRSNPLHVPPVIVPHPPGPDTTNPIISIVSPTADATILVIEYISVRVFVSDDRELEVVRVIRTDPDGSNQVLLSNFDVPEEYKNKLDFTISLTREDLKLPKSASTAAYTVIVEAEDKGQNITKGFVNVTIHAPNLNKSEFIKTFSNVNIYGYLDWMGYTIPGDPKAALNLALLVMVDKDFDKKVSETEWKKFAADFNVKDQVWAAWDMDGDGKLGDSEFNKGMEKLNFFTEWDEDKNNSLSSEELGGGFFSRWDHNQDATLSRDEYEEKYFTYILFS